MIKYNEQYPTSLINGDGLFYHLSLRTNVPWFILPDDVKRSLDRAYAIRSGEKNIYSAFSKLDMETQVTSIVAFNVEKWAKYWNLYILDYDPLAAYIVEETGEKTINSDGSNTTTYGKKETGTVSDTGTIENLHDRSTTYGKQTSTTNTDAENISAEETASSNDNEYVYGFNSVTEVPSSKNNSSDSNNSTETRNLTASSTSKDSGSDVETYVDTETRNTSNNRTNEFSGSDTEASTNEEKEVYEITKKGNIGYSTPQKMLREDFDLWKNPYFSIIFSDIDRMIMNKIYT